jgi:DNA mismatch repair protein MutS
LVNSSRFITIKLKEFEQSFLEAQNNLASIEYEIFQEIREKILDNF